MKQGVSASKAAEIDSFDPLSLSPIWHIKHIRMQVRYPHTRVRLSISLGLQRRVASGKVVIDSGGGARLSPTHENVVSTNEKRVKAGREEQLSKDIVPLV
jgi:hypothetical protein